MELFLVRTLVPVQHDSREIYEDTYGLGLQQIFPSMGGAVAREREGEREALGSSRVVCRFGKYNMLGGWVRKGVLYVQVLINTY